MTKCPICGVGFKTEQHKHFCSAGCEEASWTQANRCAHDSYARMCLKCNPGRREEKLRQMGMSTDELSAELLERSKNGTK